ncbi:deoxyhypusine synthase [Angomonas deanei]|nr:deoxyhypusine synthase [Angomonas deanei]|eukprot:EPY24426.1 deoxyhypusine synthase [Angomonas deanei]
MSNETVRTFDYDDLLAVDDATAIHQLINHYEHVGLQATAIGKARTLVQRMLYAREERESVFLSYTSNLISCGLRDTFTYLAQHRLVHGVISSAGGIEEDVIKCLGPTYLGRYDLDGVELRRQGVNRIGNLLVPNDNYCLFEDYFTPLLQAIHARQVETDWQECTSPSEIIYEMGKALESQERKEESLVYWCYKNNIPVFCPALTDGSMGDMIFFYNFSKKGMIIDPIKDVAKLRSLKNDVNSAIVLGAGLPKHNLLANIAMDRVVMVTTGVEADGCTSSCTFEDDRMCGLLHPHTTCVRVQGDATVVFPLLAMKE